MKRIFKLEYPVAKGAKRDGKRIIELDFLRGMAISMVLISHYPMFDSFRKLWMGVDLFFVLSGFLVGGLLIREFNKRGNVNVKRFLIRRGLKIYPAFYVYIFFTVGLTLVLRQMGIPAFGLVITWQAFLAEIFYVQNYFVGIWGHDWTLGVEEHFYFLLAFVFLMIRRFPDAVQKMTIIAVIGVVLVFVGRVLFVHNDDWYEMSITIMKTHFRIDSLLFGVLIACVYYNYRYLLERIPVGAWMASIVAGSIVIGIWLHYFPLDSAIMAKYGYTVLYLMLGMIMTGFLMIRLNSSEDDRWNRWFQNNQLIRLMANVGVYSYSIYLWHGMMLEVLYAIVYEYNGGNIFVTFAWRYIGFYLIMSVGFGYLMSVLIEYPFLNWRNRKFPSGTEPNAYEDKKRSNPLAG